LEETPSTGVSERFDYHPQTHHSTFPSTIEVGRLFMVAKIANPIPHSCNSQAPRDVAQGVFAFTIPISSHQSSSKNVPSLTDGTGRVDKLAPAVNFGLALSFVTFDEDYDTIQFVNNPSVMTV